MLDKDPADTSKKDIESSEDGVMEYGPDEIEVLSHDDDSDESAKKPEGEETAGAEEAVPAHKLSRKEVLNRLMEKNQLLVSLNKEKIALERQLRELNDKWLRSVAEFENYRKRSRKEWELLKQQSKSEVILEILNVVDDFERAFSVAEDAELDEFVQGIRLIYNNLLQTLERLGVQELEARLKPFDPNYHMAVGQVESEDVGAGLVAEVVQKGYHLDEIVIRPARVIVAK